MPLLVEKNLKKKETERTAECFHVVAFICKGSTSDRLQIDSNHFLFIDIQKLFQDINLTTSGLVK